MKKKITKKPVKKVAKKAAKKAVKSLTTIEQKRVEILKDAVAQLLREVYLAKQGQYILLGDDVYQDDIEKACLLVGLDPAKAELKTFLPNIVNKNKPCEVCAKGALTISAISKFNNYKALDIENLDDIASEKTRELFGDLNADLMEAYFEGNVISDDSFVRLGYTLDEIDTVSDAAREFFRKNPDSTKRLITIFNNAIKNRGKFKPELL